MPKLPQQLLNSLSQFEHFNAEAFVEAHNEENKITSIRLNPFKKTDLNFELNGQIPWTDAGFYLDKRPSFTYDPLFQAGCYYVQEPGSMVIEFALKQTLNLAEPLKILDACASPGGKSTLINSLINRDSLLIANEFVKSRTDVLTHNLSKWGTNNTVVTNNDTQRFSELTSYFDALVIDAPCSGSGLFRKQPDAIDHWSEESVNACSVRQKKILEDLMPSLKENGILVYSTCSYSAEENEEVVKWLITEFDLEYLALPVKKEWGIVETAHGYRFYPHLTKSEGFFCAALRKKSGEQSPFIPKKKNTIEVSKAELSILAPFLGLSDEHIVKKNNNFHLLNLAALNFLIAFEKQFYFKKAGAVIGEIKGKDMVPNHELALIIAINKGLPRLELNEEQAIRFLRKENFEHQSSEKGLVLVSYKDQGLGWAKILPNRLNNYFPNELRILN
ncbi:MAG: RNA methyltransferase [Bacteroidetes bacterium]|nr:RNA methyltransferase [Bacteroidota bacterium]